MSITNLESSMINRIVHDEFQPTNGGEPEKFSDLGEVWAEIVVNDATDKGVIGSLVKKGLIGASGYVESKRNGKMANDATFWLTAAGWEVYVNEVRKEVA
jgi:hypothetical protein